MADQVHPTDSPPRPSAFSDKSLLKNNPQSPDKTAPPPGTYVVQIPKDQVYRVPPPENAKRYQQYTTQKHRRSRCCFCLCSLLAFLVCFVLLLAIAAGVFYLIVRPESPNYSINAMAINGINITSSLGNASTSFSPTINVQVRADNPNDKIGIYYEKQSSMEVHYSDVKLCEGALPEFYQPSNNETIFQITLKGSGVKLSNTTNRALYDSQKQGQVALEMDLSAPVRLKVGSVKTWEITVKVQCEVTVDKLAAEAKIVSQKCNYRVELW